MTTRTYTSVIDHTSDAGFRAWGSELSTNLAATGLLQTADTGQINWATVTRPAINIIGGYEIWKLPDSSLYFKLEYGTDGTSNIPIIYVTVATGSDGAGNLTGQASTRTKMTAGQPLVSTSTAYTTYICVTSYALLIVFKNGGLTSGYPIGVVCVGKTVDNTGSTTTIGFGIFIQNGTAPFLQSVRITDNPQTLASSVYFSIVPGAVTSSLVNGTIAQIYLWWLNIPDVQPFVWAGSYVSGELTQLNTVTLPLVSTTTHTYLAFGLISNGVGVANGQNSTYRPVFIWE